ncbi:hypothetical protein [Granulicella mallensis]|uniref:Uncharacterized protein n=1 Tax=Granulicella mallensis TaxID=940614 RepID=A0A7W8EBW8_9BACT|nr:hypothetical protein [Granulicella mallensis]MBB5066272.1 hypothetical protein [Granulicella mallensis]
MNFETTTVTRRTVLGGVLASAVASMVPSTVFAEVVDFGADGCAHGSHSNKANLYAFPGVQPETTVIAATWPVRLNRFDSSAQKESQVTIHAGAQRWDVELPRGAADAVLLEQHGSRIFAGSVATRPGTDGVVLKAVIIEMPKKVLGGSGAMDIWAERVLHAGQRQRVGSPFIAALVAEDAGLARSYHNISPSDDREMLMEGVVKAIAAKGRKSGMAGDPDAYARRLASRLLPDVLHYDPQWPSGFTFAAQNGRHPEEVSDLVVNTILSGSPAPGSPKADVRLQTPFPFFSRHDSAA